MKFWPWKQMDPWKVAERDQLRERRECGYVPICKSALDRSDKAFAVPPASREFFSLSIYRTMSAKIIYLYGSARAMLLLQTERGGGPSIGPSETFDRVSSDLIDILDGSLSEVPTDLLILSSGASSVLNREEFSIESILRRAAEYENDRYHSLVHLEARLIREYVGPMGSGTFRAFRRAMKALNEVGLFQDDDLAPLALDFFPSLALRRREILTQRAALTWRPEGSDDPVVKNL